MHQRTPADPTGLKETIPVTPRHRGFTLLEILIAVAIIAILIGMAFVGMRAMGRGASENDTRVRLGTARALLNDFLDATKGGTGKRPQPQGWDYNDFDGSTPFIVLPGDVAPNGKGLNFWTLPSYQDTNLNNAREEGEPIVPLVAPGPYSATAANEPYQYYNTRVAQRLIQSIPAVKAQLNSMPSNVIETTAAPPPPGFRPTANAKHLLDAWGNPILFVPGGGLMGVRREGYSAVNDINNPIKSPDERPFWASAGPDGNFAEGDDNLYSFEN